MNGDQIRESFLIANSFEVRELKERYKRLKLEENLENVKLEEKLENVKKEFDNIKTLITNLDALLKSF